jgi:site-specific recombinase XerD
MLEIYFEAPATLRRLRSGPTGPLIDGFAAALQEASYTRWTARGYLRAVAHLGMWLETSGTDVAGLCEPILEDFASHFPKCTCVRRNLGVFSDAVAGVRHFLAHLRANGLTSPSEAVSEVSLPEWLVEYEAWMVRHRGVRPSSMVTYRLPTVELWEFTGGPAGFTARSLRRFVSARATRHGRSRAKTVVTATRMFVRYAVVHDLCAPELVDAIPTYVDWKLSTLPAYVSPDVVERLVDIPDVGTATGLRDRAILLLLARLGLRAGDVAAMRMRDIHWENGTLEVSGKGRRTTRLPLPQDVGDAVLRYIEEGRPEIADPHLFLRVRPPVGKLRTSAAVSDIVNRTAARAGIELPRTGAHVLRHSLATSLLRDGMPLAAIGVVLRHKNEQTTALYAKVDTNTLGTLAQPWPEEVV